MAVKAVVVDGLPPEWGVQTPAVDRGQRFIERRGGHNREYKRADGKRERNGQCGSS